MQNSYTKEAPATGLVQTIPINKQTYCAFEFREYAELPNNDFTLLNFYINIGLAKGAKLMRLKRILTRNPYYRKQLGGGELNVKVRKQEKVLLLGSGALKIGEAGESV